MTIVLPANASDAGALSTLPLPLIRIRGQVTRLPRALLPQLHVTLCCDGYLCPTPDGDLNLGASFDVGDEDGSVRMKRGKSCVVVRPNRASTLDPFNASTQFRPRLLDRC